MKSYEANRNSLLEGSSRRARASFRDIRAWKPLRNSRNGVVEVARIVAGGREDEAVEGADRWAMR